VLDVNNQQIERNLPGCRRNTLSASGWLSRWTGARAHHTHYRKPTSKRRTGYR